MHHGRPRQHGPEGQHVESKRQHRSDDATSSSFVFEAPRRSGRATSVGRGGHLRRSGRVNRDRDEADAVMAGTREDEYATWDTVMEGMSASQRRAHDRGTRRARVCLASIPVLCLLVSITRPLYASYIDVFGPGEGRRGHTGPSAGFVAGPSRLSGIGDTGDERRGRAPSARLSRRRRDGRRWVGIGRKRSGCGAGGGRRHGAAAAARGDITSRPSQPGR